MGGVSYRLEPSAFREEGNSANFPQTEGMSGNDRRLGSTYAYIGCRSVQVNTGKQALSVVGHSQ